MYNNKVITDILLLTLNLLLAMVHSLFALINFVLPSQIAYYFGLFFSYASFGQGIFPIGDILLALFTVLSVWSLLYVVKLILWALKIFPYVGRLVGLPQHETYTRASSFVDDNGNVHVTTLHEDSTRTKRWMR